MLARFASPRSYPEDQPLARLSRDQVDDALIYTLELVNKPDNRLTPDLCTQIGVALDDVEREWRADRDHELDGGPGTGKAALVTVGLLDRGRFFSNGLNLELALSTEGFFNNTFHPMHARLLTFPVPSVAALMGHAFAGGMTLAMAHDYRILKGGEGKARAMMCMNEIEFGANLPPGMAAVLMAKAPSPKVLRDIIGGQRYAGSEALDAGLVDGIGKDVDDVVQRAKALAVQAAPKASKGVWGMLKTGVYKETLRILADPTPNIMADDSEEAAERLGPEPRRSKL